MTSVITKIQLRRGNLVDLPTLSIGEPAFVLDEKTLYIGHEDGNVQITVGDASTTVKGKVQLSSADSYTGLGENDKVITEGVLIDVLGNYFGALNDLLEEITGE